jgi:hypothetical protein
LAARADGCGDNDDGGYFLLVDMIARTTGIGVPWWVVVATVAVGIVYVVLSRRQ